MPLSISGSVGEGGVNNAADVQTIFSLFNKILSPPLPAGDQCTPALIQAIRNFQSAFLSTPDGRIDVNGRTWKRLVEAAEKPPDDPEEEEPGDLNLGGADSAWIARHQWNESYEVEFSAWIEKLFTNKGPTVTSCLRNPAGNSLYSDEDRNRSVYSDCADLPYLLRAYFSYKKKLPFSYTRSTSGSRYTSGNKPGERRSFLDYASLSKLFAAISSNVHSGFFRLAWATEKSDTFLAEISRESIVPGVAYYDANGHVLVVSKVDADGTVWFVDGHPDNSLTKKRFGESLSRGSCTSGGGFRAWRKQTVDGNGNFVLKGNANSKGYDTDKTQCQSKYSVGGFDLNYHQWVKRKLAGSNVKIDPMKELTQQLTAFHDALKERVDSVKAAVSNHINQKPHPSDLPHNIYSTEGEWESYATPSRDARLRGQVREMFNLITQSVTAVAQGNHPYLFSGTAKQLVQEYDAIWNDKSANLKISYPSSDDAAVSLTLAVLMDRLFKLSFDPYHCPELRWGDTQSGSCADNSSKRGWYDREQRLRNVIEPDGTAHTTLDWGPATTPDIHLKKLLDRLKQQHA